jgi:hypothetical protein
MSDDTAFELIDLRSDITEPATRRALCLNFFEQVYQPAFPRPDETETPDDWLSLINSDPVPPSPVLHVIVARRSSNGGKILAGILIEYYRQSRAALVTYIAVDPNQRQNGLARRLLRDAIARVTIDNGGVRPPIFAEVERPDAQHNEGERLMAEKRAAIIDALGGRRIQVDYIQPRLGPEKQPVKDLMLVLLIPDGPRIDSLPTETIRAFLVEFFDSLRQSYTPELTRVLSSLPSNDVTPLRSLR